MAEEDDIRTIGEVVSVYREKLKTITDEIMVKEDYLSLVN